MPTILTICRVILTGVVIYQIAIHASPFFIIVTFGVAALTDLADGKIARKYGLVSQFGARADMFADRVLWTGTALAMLIVYGGEGRINIYDCAQVVAILSREILSAPFALYALVRGGAFPAATYQAKLTTFVQGVALPAVLLSIFYPSWRYLSVPLSIVLLPLGIGSALQYIQNTRRRTAG